MAPEIVAPVPQIVPPALVPPPGNMPAPEVALIHPESRLNWTNLTLLVAIHMLAVVAVAYMIWGQYSGYTVGLGVVWLGLCGFAVTGGYHRLFAHPTYQAIWPLRLFHLLFGAAAVQNSALAWSRDHRVHHRFVDHAEDPYNIKRGFWWAHIGWIFYETKKPKVYSNVQDLLADPLICWQERYYIPIALFMGALLPMLIGMLWGDPIGCLLVVGPLRLVLLWHFTFTINSVAHILGHRPYSLANTARDSWITAIVSLGEGYHNYHHRFPTDYRNGVRFFHYDPTKWVLSAFSWVGITSHLRRMPDELVQRAMAEVRSVNVARAAAKAAARAAARAH